MKQDILTIDSLLKGLYGSFPKAAQACQWPHEELQWWMEWPPDVFALTSLVLAQTGAYRWHVSPPAGLTTQAYEPPKAPGEYIDDAPLVFKAPEMDSKPRRKSQTPSNGSVNLSSLGHVRSGWLGLLTAKFREVPGLKLFDDEHVLDTLVRLHQRQSKSNKVVGGPSPDEITGLHEVGWRLRRLLVDLRHVNLRLEDYPDPKPDRKPDRKTKAAIANTIAAMANILWLHAAADETCQPIGVLAGGFGRETMAYVMAHLMLEHNGSLARWPRNLGLVVPKMRTTQRGLTLRSASHNLSFHRTEVKVAWRSFPWMDNKENRINAMLVPWPFEVKARQFRPLPPQDNHSLGQPNPNFGFFGFRCEEQKPDEEMSEISSVVDTVERLFDRSHKEVNQVHALIFPELSLSQLEFAAILDRLKDKSYKNGKKGDDQSQIPPVVIGGIRHRENDTAVNQMAVAAYFWDRWYIYTQNKHHRWLLDKPQIDQYRLGTQLSGKKGWWEGIQISERKLTFFNPNRWLTLCPLICEDLARIDPVSELIRGIGPTFLVALLMDGPQLQQRWPARYASVFADDPGSSVLTLTSLGMASLSRLVQEQANRTVASWSQLDKTIQPIMLDHQERAALLTITGSYSEELALDGRSDGKSASYLHQNTVHQFEMDSSKTLRKLRKPDLKYLQKLWDDSQAGEQSDLTLLAFTVDACLEAPDYVLHDIRKLAGIESLKDYKEYPVSVMNLLEGKVSLDDTWRNRLAEFSAFMNNFRHHTDSQGKMTNWIDWEDHQLEKRLRDWQNIFEAIQKQLDQKCNDDRKYAFALILWALHNRTVQFLKGPKAEQQENKELGKQLEEFSAKVSQQFVGLTREAAKQSTKAGKPQATEAARGRGVS